MTNEQAIIELRDLISDDRTDKENEALLFAIKTIREDTWIPVSERLPEEKTNPNTRDFEEVLCTTIWGDVRVYKFGKPIGHDTAHFWYGPGIMDEYIVKWRSLPKAPEKENK